MSHCPSAPQFLPGWPAAATTHQGGARPSAFTQVTPPRVVSGGRPVGVTAGRGVQVGSVEIPAPRNAAEFTQSWGQSVEVPAQRSASVFAADRMGRLSSPRNSGPQRVQLGSAVPAEIQEGLLRNTSEASLPGSQQSQEKVNPVVATHHMAGSMRVPGMAGSVPRSPALHTRTSLAAPTVQRPPPQNALLLTATPREQSPTRMQPGQALAQSGQAPPQSGRTLTQSPVRLQQRDIAPSPRVAPPTTSYVRQQQRVAIQYGETSV